MYMGIPKVKLGAEGVCFLFIPICHVLHDIVLPAVVFSMFQLF